MADINVETTFGSLLMGGLFAFAMTGLVNAQALIYWRLYDDDGRLKKAMVAVVWVLDLLHSAFIMAALYDYFIKHFGDTDHIDHLPWTVALTVVTTAAQTMIYHFHFAQKIFFASRRNWWITGPIIALAFARLVAAMVSTGEMVALKKYSAFTKVYPGWVFTLGLSLSALVDILVTGWLCYFLKDLKERVNMARMVRVVDSLILYTLENGLLTCLLTTASLICWLSMNYNLVFLGLHFVIGKLYANSLLASLNTRKAFRQMRSTGAITFSQFNTSQNIASPRTPTMKKPPPVSPTDSDMMLSVRKLEVTVERTVERSSDEIDLELAK